MTDKLPRGVRRHAGKLEISYQVEGHRHYEFLKHLKPTKTGIAEAVHIREQRIEALKYGIEPELDTLRTMLEPKAQAPGGVLTLASLGGGKDCSLSASVLLFSWGSHLLPVFLTSVSIEEKAFLPSLVPYRAEATLSLQVIESANPFFLVEQIRQAMGAGLNTGRTVAAAIGGMF